MSRSSYEDRLARDAESAAYRARLRSLTAPMDATAHGSSNSSYSYDDDQFSPGTRPGIASSSRTPTYHGSTAYSDSRGGSDDGYASSMRPSHASYRRHTVYYHDEPPSPVSRLRLPPAPLPPAGRPEFGSRTMSYASNSSSSSSRRSSSVASPGWDGRRHQPQLQLQRYHDDNDDYFSYEDGRGRGHEREYEYGYEEYGESAEERRQRKDERRRERERERLQKYGGTDPTKIGTRFQLGMIGLAIGAAIAGHKIGKELEK